MLLVPGLKVEGLYRRCGVVPQISKLVDALSVSPRGTLLETDELSILDISGALKQILRQSFELIPNTHRPRWLKAAGTSALRHQYSIKTQLGIALVLSVCSQKQNKVTACVHVH